MATTIIQNGKSKLYGSTTRLGKPKSVKQLVFNGCKQKRLFVKAVADYLAAKESFTKAENAINAALDNFELRPNTTAQTNVAECLRLNAFINQCKNYAKIKSDAFCLFLEKELKKWTVK